mgnify:CR=1 FL=1
MCSTCADAVGAAAPRALPGWLQRAVAPFKPLLRPLARKVGLSPTLDAQAEDILLAQIEEFRPDLIINQDTFHVNASLMRCIKGIGRPILIGQIGIEPSRGEDWSVYDLMMSQMAGQMGMPFGRKGSGPSRKAAKGKNKQAGKKKGRGPTPPKNPMGAGLPAGFPDLTGMPKGLDELPPGLANIDLSKLKFPGQK